MLRLTVKQFKTAAVLWLIIISILFFLPGSALPKEEWLGTIHFDKWVHFGFFALLIFLWRYYFPPVAKYSILLLLAALVYGLGVELIQHHWIANRSFDIGDVMADMAGAVGGVLFWGWYKKNRPL